jgi:hypothetical protein
MDTLHFCLFFSLPFVFYVIFSSLYGVHHSLFLLVHLSLHPAQHTDNTDFFPALTSFPPLPLPWIPVHLLEVASVAPGVCSRLPFCVYQNMLDWGLRKTHYFTHYKL